MNESTATDAGVFGGKIAVNVIAGLVLFLASTAPPALVVLWSDHRTLDRAVSQHVERLDALIVVVDRRLQDLEQFRVAGDRFTADDGRRHDDRLRRLESWRDAVLVKLAELGADIRRLDAELSKSARSAGP